jgi:glycosyl transferase family 1
MRIVFVYYLMNKGGSAQDVYHYTRAAKMLGHEVVVYGVQPPDSPFSLSREIDFADAVFFIFEWTQALRYGDALDLSRLIGRVPRDRRFVIDCDGAYNDRIVVDGDYNHEDDAASQTWLRVCHSVSDRIFQPTMRPLRPNVRTFFFHGYDPGWEQPIRSEGKEYGMVYVGHSRFRWGPMSRVLHALEPIRKGLGRIALVGHGWDAVPSWAERMGIEQCFRTDAEYLRQMDVEFVGEVDFEQAIPWMARGVFNPVLYRPLFRHLGMVTCRTFETPAAGTIPIFDLDEDYVSEIYGAEACQLVLPLGNAGEKIRDVVGRPDYYADIVLRIRQRLAERHSFEARVQELVSIVQA